ncbi:MAG: flagellar motor protein MotB [Lachnospiraceae bacterium]
MAKKKQDDAPAGSPAWMATFSDLMNLLLCFFVLLFSMSSVDAAKFNEVVASLQSSFSILPSGGSTIGEGEMVGNGISQLKELDVYFNEAMTSNSNGENKEQGEGNSDYVKEYEDAATQESEKMAEEIEGQLDKAGLSDQVNVEFNEQYVLLTLNGAILFESGKADIQSEAKPIIKKLAQIIDDYGDNIIEVEGHTDNVPLNGGQYKNNNVLSTFRALAVADYIKEVSDVNPKYLKFSGRGSYVPVADNSTAAGRAKNRRVEIKVYNSMYSGN